MATLLDTQSNQPTGPVKGGSNANGNDNPFSKISAGPAALAQLMIYQIMALYAEILKLAQEQKVNMTNAQTKEAQAQADETIAGGNDQFWMYMSSAIASTVGALVSFGVQKVLSSNAEATGAAKAETEARASYEKDLKIEEVIKGNPDERVGGAEPEEKLTKDDDLVKAFKRGEFKDANEDEQKTKDVVRYLRESGKADDEEFDYDAWEKKFHDNKMENSRNLNTAVQRRNNIMMDITNKRAIVDQASQVSSNTTNAIFSAKKSKRDAGASLFQNSAQMAGSSASDFGQAANKAFDSQNAEIQILENINRTNSVSG